MEENVKLNEIIFLRSTLILLIDLICIENDDRLRLELYNHQQVVKKLLVSNVRDYLKEDQILLSRFDEQIFHIELIELLVLRNIEAF